jgi:hypothetical protein
MQKLGVERKSRFLAKNVWFENFEEMVNLHKIHTLVETGIVDHVAGGNYPDNAPGLPQDLGLFHPDTEIECLPKYTTSLAQLFNNVQGMLHRLHMLLYLVCNTRTLISINKSRQWY